MISEDKIFLMIKYLKKKKRLVSCDKERHNLIIVQKFLNSVLEEGVDKYVDKLKKTTEDLENVMVVND